MACGGKLTSTPYNVSTQEGGNLLTFLLSLERKVRAVDHGVLTGELYVEDGDEH